MIFAKQFFYGAFLVIATSAAAQQIDYKGLPEWSWGKKDSTEFYLYSPSSLKAGEKYPLILFLHGCCGEDYHATLRNTVDPPVRVWHNFGANTQRIPTYIVSPKTKVGWKQHIENLKFIIDSLVTNHQADPRRIYISGFSMGSQGTWEFIEKFPDYFAAAIAMGMDFKGKTEEKFKDIPIWAIRGEKDWWARHLGKQMAEIRKLNGGDADSSDWVTGINPRITTFKGMEHGVMWPAVSKLHLLDWAYSKVNDGNKYPVVFLKSPAYKREYKEGETIDLDIAATDPDGTISRVEIFSEGKLLKALHSTPYKFSFNAAKGDMKITVTAFDNQNKSSTAESIIKVNIPAELIQKVLPDVHAGDYYDKEIEAKGNGEITYTVLKSDELPQGLVLTKNGIIKGIPVKEGRYTVTIAVRDEDEDLANAEVQLHVLKKKPNEVVVKGVKNYRGKRFPTAKVKLGELPHNRDDDEVTFSGGLQRYEGLTLIQTDPNDTVEAKPYYLQFEVDEDVTVYIAYEKLGHPFPSRIPEWLKSYRKETEEQIVAQYFYYDVYAKDFPKGVIMLPDAQEVKNGVNTNYFVMIKKKKSD
jgi:dienelactone hydrolase